MSSRIPVGISIAIAALVAAGQAAAQGRLDAKYKIAIGSLGIGQLAWTVDIGPERYSAAASASASGWVSVLVSGQGEAQVQGAVVDGAPSPQRFTFKSRADDETVDVKLALDKGNVTELSVGSASAPLDRVPLSQNDMRGVADPLSALVLPVGGSSDVINAGKILSDEVCRPRVAIFDGRRRFDLGLTFKRVDKVSTERGYGGPAVVCALTFRPISGHSASSPFVRYLASGRDMELWLAPLAGTHLAAPIRLTVNNLIGTLAITATQFDMASTAAERTTIVPNPDGTARLRRDKLN